MPLLKQTASLLRQTITLVAKTAVRFDDAAQGKFDSFISADYNRPGQKLYVLFRFAVIATFIVLIINLSSIGKIGFGEWGDFFGGTLNPILTFLTFMGLLITIVLQQTELRESREEFRRSATALEMQNRSIEKQSFEATFFQMLSLHNQIVNSIDLMGRDGREARGRDCFQVFYNRLARAYRDNKSRYRASKTEHDIIAASYKDFWQDSQNELGHYFRYLFNIVRFLKESDYDVNTYMRLVRAQLSDRELLILFYNCLTPQGIAFKALAEEFALLNNMPRIQLLDRGHEALLASTAYGDRVANKS